MMFTVYTFQGSAILSESVRNRRFLEAWNRYRNRIVPIPGIGIGISINSLGFSLELESNMVLSTKQIYNSAETLTYYGGNLSKIWLCRSSNFMDGPLAFLRCENFEKYAWRNDRAQKSRNDFLSHSSVLVTMAYRGVLIPNYEWIGLVCSIILAHKLIKG